MTCVRWSPRSNPEPSEVVPEGLEPPTNGLEIRCSIQLSYGTIYQESPIFTVFSCIFATLLSNSNFELDARFDASAIPCYHFRRQK